MPMTRQRRRRRRRQVSEEAIDTRACLMDTDYRKASHNMDIATSDCEIEDRNYPHLQFCREKWPMHAVFLIRTEFLPMAV